MPRPLRSSCDRCHSQKLKCPKETWSPNCLRCVKADVNCVFSPAGPARRRAPVSPKPFYQDDTPFIDSSIGIDMSDILDIQFPWPSIDTGECVNSAALASSAIESHTRTSHQDSRSTCVQQLTTLALEIDGISLSLQPLANIHLPRGHDIETVFASHVEDLQHSQCLEKLFDSAQRLVDIYPSTQQLMINSRPLGWDDCTEETCLHHMDVSKECPGVLREESEPAAKVDLFLFNLLAACHTKVLDIFAFFIKSSKLCAKITTANGMVQPRFHTPELKPGNFVVSAMSAGSMQVALVVHITGLLEKRARNLGKAVQDATMGEEKGKEARMISLQCQILEERSRCQTEEFVRLRDSLMEFVCPE
ncbi:hypothetical protein F5Y18DRAFT_389149 [Xylariaceae sp. FL1019]|nr:hypothetical protein F5Y18DRAFT_389149 [Xylariaceae sp. FL1019]